MPGGVPFEYNKPTVDEIMAQTSPDNTSVYIGGVPPGATGFILLLFLVFLFLKIILVVFPF